MTKGKLMNTKNFILAAVISSALAGCASTPEHSGKVEELRTEYSSLSNNPEVVRSASIPLKKAEAELAKAELAVKKGADDDVVDHLTYIAEKKIQIVKAKISEAEAETFVADAELKRKDLRIEATEQKLLEAEKSADKAQARAERLDAEAKKMAAEADKLQADLADVKAKQSEKGLVLTLSDILFATNKAELAAGSERSLSKIAEFLNKYPDQSIVIEGHTDSTGASGYNQELSERRANSVGQQMISLGVNSDRIKAVGMGENYPVASNDTSAGRQQNRRVEIVVQNNGKVASKLNTAKLN